MNCILTAILYDLMEKSTGKSLDPFSFLGDNVCFILLTSDCIVLDPTVLDRNNPVKYSNSLLQNIQAVIPERSVRATFQR